MRRAHYAAAERDPAAREPLRREPRERCAAADDIGDRVGGAELVERDVAELRSP